MAMQALTSAPWARKRPCARCSRILPDLDLELDVIPVEVLNKIIVSKDDFISALREMQPSALREVVVESPNTHWEDIGGLEEAKRELREAVE